MQVRVSSRPSLWVLWACLILAACDIPATPPARTLASVPDPSPVAGVGYIVFDAQINRATSADLIKDFDSLQAQGAREISLGINSPGGDFKAAESIVAEMDRLHAADGIVFTAYNLRFVASAATLVFLNAQHRYAVSRSAFLFHAPVDVAAGTFSAEALRKAADEVDQATQTFRTVLLARTRLTRQQADVYVTRTVALSSTDAQQDGVIDAVQSPSPPKGAREWLIKTRPRQPVRPAPDAQEPPNQPASTSPS